MDAGGREREKEGARARVTSKRYKSFADQFITLCYGCFYKSFAFTKNALRPVNHSVPLSFTHFPSPAIFRWLMNQFICNSPIENYRHLCDICNHFAYAHTFSIFIYFICAVLLFSISFHSLGFRRNSYGSFVMAAHRARYVEHRAHIVRQFKFVVVFLFFGYFFDSSVLLFSCCCFYLPFNFVSLLSSAACVVYLLLLPSFLTVLFQVKCAHMNQYSNHGVDPKRMM